MDRALFGRLLRSMANLESGKDFKWRLSVQVGNLVKLIIDDCDGTGTNTPILTDATFLVLDTNTAKTGDVEVLVQCISEPTSRFECNATNFWVIS